MNELGPFLQEWFQIRGETTGKVCRTDNKVIKEGLVCRLNYEEK